jgi:hypothetical protein
MAKRAVYYQLYDMQTNHRSAASTNAAPGRAALAGL